jgi:stage III sporulation protein AE
VFTNFTSAFNTSFTGEMGFLVIYLVLFSIVFKSFSNSIAVADVTLKNISMFMNVLVPCFLGSVAATGNITTATGMYATMAFGINLIELLISRIILPAIKIYLIIEFMNTFTKEKMLSKAAKSLKQGIMWVLTLTISIVLGYNGLKTIMLPSIDNVVGKSARRLMGAVPVVGDALDSASETIVGSGMLVKNSIGVGGIIVLIIICLIPIMKLLTLTVLYKAAAALLEPICDKKVVNCIENSGEATKLLLVAVVVSMLLLVLMLAIVIAGTRVV